MAPGLYIPAEVSSDELSGEKKADSSGDAVGESEDAKRERERVLAASEYGKDFFLYFCATLTKKELKKKKRERERKWREPRKARAPARPIVVARCSCGRTGFPYGKKNITGI